MRLLPLLLGLSSLLAFGCGPAEPEWEVVHENLPAALLSVWGTAADDVWAVGADPGDGSGPLVLHYDGASWKRRATGDTGDLWWVFGFEKGPVYLSGAGGRILRFADGEFTALATPSQDVVVFGLWGSSPEDLWAVGGAAGGAQGAFAWRLQGDTWVEAEGFPAALSEGNALWKVSGRSADDVWMVGTDGALVHWNGQALELGDAQTGESLFTVASTPDLSIAVGGFGTGSILENDGSGWKNVGPGGMSPVVGVAAAGEVAYAVGQFGATYVRSREGWREDEGAPQLPESLHAVWIDPDGGVWSVGGQIMSLPLVEGVLLHKGSQSVSGEITQ